jgi:hypothetical protein
VPKENNIYDLVERQAARSGIPRIQLWQSVAKALVEKRLVPSKLPNLSVPFNDWLIGFKASVDRYNDPNSGVVRILKQIVVRTSDFEKWRKWELSPGRRGPRQKTTGYEASDRKLFPRVKKLISSGEARSAHGAARIIADKISGPGTPESRAKRLSARYREENLDNC